MTLDGKVTRPNGKWFGLSSISDKTRMDIIRSKSDTFIVGKNSILNDDPEVKIRYVENKNPPRPVILLQTSSLPKDRKIFQCYPIILCTSSNYDLLKSDFENLAEIHCISKTKKLNPNSVLKKFEELNFKNILLEGGPTLNYSFLKEDLIDKIYLTIVPFIIGKNNLSSIVNGKQEINLFEKKKWRLISFESEKDEIFLEYEKKF